MKRWTGGDGRSGEDMTESTVTLREGSELLDQQVVAGPASPSSGVRLPPPPPPVPSETEGPPAPLGSDFTRLWGAAAVSAVGDGVRDTALPLLATVLTRNPVLIAGILFASKLPWLLCSLPAGAIADRVDRRRLVVYVNVFRALVMGALFAVVATGGGSLWLLYTVAFLQGVGEVFSDNTAFAMMPVLVPKSGLEKANGRLEAAAVMGQSFIGPALGGVLFAAAAGIPFGLDAASFVVAAVLFASIGFRAPRVEKAPSTLGADIREGLSWLRGHVLLRNLSVFAALTNFVLHATFGIFVLYAVEILRLEPAGYGLLLSVEAVGVLCGSLLAAGIKRRIGIGPSILVSLLIAGAANFVIGANDHVVIVAAMMVAISFCAGVWNVVTNSLRQATVPDRLMGRVQSAHRLLSWGAIPVGTMFGGAIADAFGLRAPFYVASVALLILAVAAYALVARAGPPASSHAR
jgi:MFS family permease